jgi:hypothetical protein
MDWIRSCKVLFNRPKVVHRLPGRLRVHVPLLQKLPMGQQHLADRVASLVSVPDEIESASANLMTGNALICFDPATVSETDLLDYLRGMFEIFVRNRASFEEIATEGDDEAFEKLEQVIRGAVSPRLKLDPRLVLEKHVLE